MSPVALSGNTTSQTRYPARRSPGAHMGEYARWGVSPVPGTRSAVGAAGGPLQCNAVSNRSSGTEYGGTAAVAPAPLVDRNPYTPAATATAIAMQATMDATNRTRVRACYPSPAVGDRKSVV